ncbi:hypothetical protein DSO57_1001587 [Entomophthora muscae]|uniref:Uncharacterized protein n=1 Tax=Entomophthora muscae TaxID=34485 RepID=A0ACC2SB79_9FUNG|nr:hypothetical protein DSO57_1001587 [Entomophthora muscae]
MGATHPNLKALYYHSALNIIHTSRRAWILENKPIYVTLMIHQWKLEVMRYLERIHKFGHLIPGKFQTRGAAIANCQYLRYNSIGKRIEPIWRAGSPIDFNLEI